MGINVCLYPIFIKTFLPILNEATSDASTIFSPESYSYTQRQPTHFYFRASPGGGTEFVDVDSSLDGTSMPSFHNIPPQSLMGSAPAGSGGSRPGSSHSAPMLDLSIDRHYEFDAARTPTDDLGHVSGMYYLSKLIFLDPRIYLIEICLLWF